MSPLPPGRAPVTPVPGPADPVVCFDEVSRSFAPSRRGQPPTHALDAVTLTLAAGEIVSVVGPSGCGKTTLLELACGLQRPDTGTVRAQPAALMPQRDLLLAWRSALDNAALPLRLQGVPRDAARERARELFTRFGLAGFERARPAELSGGMRQRISLLRSLLADKPVLALDEPLAALDAITRADMQAWLADALTAAGRTVLLVTHDVEEAVLLADRVLVLSPRPGRILAEVPVALPRPRHRAQAGVVALRSAVLRELGVPA